MAGLDSYIIKPELFTGKLKTLVYGEPGSGKTFLAGTSQDHPDMRNTHFFNIDGGMLTLAERGDIEATDIKTLDQLESELYRIVAVDSKYANIHTAVIDNVTELQTLALEGRTRAEFNERRKKDKSYTIDDVYIEDYGTSGKQLARVLRGFRDLPINVIYIAHKKDKKRKNSDIIEESKPSLTEKLCTAVMGYMDFVWYLYTSDIPTTVGDNQTINITHRFMLTQPYNGFICKTRGTRFAAAMGGVVQDPTFPEIMDLYLECGGLK